MKNKRGMQEDLYTVMFISLNIIFFSMMFMFISNSKDSALAYEQIYSKQVALLLDSAYPGMVFDLNFDQGFKIAEKNGKSSQLLVIDEKNNEVNIYLRSSGGYSESYISEYKFNVTEFPSTKKIRIEVLEDE